MTHPDMRDKKQITVKMTEQFAKDLNLLFASYGVTDLSSVVRESVGARADYVRLMMERGDALKASGKGMTHDPDCEKAYHAPGDCGPIPY